MSSRPQHRIKFISNVPIVLRDGTTTYADIYRPDVRKKVPALLQRTPYDKSIPGSKSMLFDAVKAAMVGYAVVIQDVRGCFTSEGEFVPFINEINDGYDSVEWVAGQDWCTGKVGMYGCSYIGATQWLAAKSRPPSLACIAPGVTASDYHEGWTWQGGAFELGFNLSWTLGGLVFGNWEQVTRKLGLSKKQYEHLIDSKDNLTEWFQYLPLDGMPELKGGLAPYYFEWLSHPEYDDFWKRVCIEDCHSAIDVPAFNFGGWYDIFLGGTIRNYTGMKDNGPNDASRNGRLYLGPWGHSWVMENTWGECNFGTRSISAFDDLQGRMMKFYDRWLKGIDDDTTWSTPVRIFVMGENKWRDENEWPLKRARMTNYYLHSSGHANTLDGDGELASVRPGEEPSDAYTYDPETPVPTRGGQLCCDFAFLPPGPFDHQAIEKRQDVLVYTTPFLQEAVEVTGPVTVTLFASSSAIDTDFTAKLLDVYPCGKAYNLTDGIIRARYRVPRTPASFIEQGKVYEYRIDLWATSNLFKAGHRIRLEISSSNFPRFDRNSNTGQPIGSSHHFIPADQVVYHSSKYPSHITLPVVPRD